MNNSFCAALIIINKTLRPIKSIFIIIAHISFLSLFIYLSCLYADTIYFKDGTSIEGEIIGERYNAVTIKEYIPPAITKTTECLKSQILKIERQPTKEAIKLAQDVAGEKKKKNEDALKKTVDDASGFSQKIAGKKELEKQKEKTKVKPQVKETAKLAVSKMPEATKGSTKKGALKAKEQKPAAEKKVTREKIVKIAKPAPQVRLKAKQLEYKLVLRNTEKRIIGSGKMKRTQATITVPVSMTNQELKGIFSDVLKKQLALNNDLDALWITVYSDREINGLPRAYGIWAPAQGWDDFRNASDKSKYKWDYRFLYNR
ncbi:MAG: hypothetical protein PHT41_07870 [Candidatus Omnitrophica bacterium]|nr:hypothetical protein [Candidatus Omnitrophota bacterium]MDD5238806.1 hypothetical protein [Candidatus Omnitrophota bacterium]